MNESPAFVREIMAFCGLDLIQFHGEESPEVCKAFMPRAIKAFRVRDGSVLPLIRPYKGSIRAVLLDTFSHERHGGTGQTFDWDIAVTAKEMRIPVILSGGLNPFNIRDAIWKASPFAVDVNSGIEKRPGKKDPDLMTEFMGRIKALGRGRAPNE